jgi:hypothetical protein
LRLFVALYASAASAQKLRKFRFPWLQRWRKRAKHQLRAQPLCEMCLARGQVTAACICDPRRAARRRLEPVLAHSARAITLAHRAPLKSTTPHGATRLAEVATADTTRSHAGAPVRDGLRLINA